MALQKDVKDKAGMLRYFFDKFDYIDDLNSIRPTTQIELEMREMSKSPFEMFIQEFKDSDENSLDNSDIEAVEKLECVVEIDNIKYYRIDKMFEMFNNFCYINKYKKKLTIKTFSVKLKENGFVCYGRHQIDKQRMRLYYLTSTNE